MGSVFTRGPRQGKGVFSERHDQHPCSFQCQNVGSFPFVLVSFMIPSMLLITLWKTSIIVQLHRTTSNISFSTFPFTNTTHLQFLCFHLLIFFSFLSRNHRFSCFCALFLSPFCFFNATDYSHFHKQYKNSTTTGILQSIIFPF